MKKLPTGFKLGGYNFTVKQVSEEEMTQLAGEEAYGLFSPDTLSIYLRKPTRQLKLSVVMATFWHEFFHALFWAASHQWTNEKLVDQCGYLMHQFHETVEFKKPD